MTRGIIARSRQFQALSLVLLTTLAGCQPAPPVDPLTEAANPRLSDRQRVAHIEEAWKSVREGRVNGAAIRPETKEIAWGTGNPASVRLAAFDALLADPDPANLDDTRAMMRLRLPRERDRVVVAYLAGVAQGHHWTDATPALVRSLSQVMPGVSDDKRPERSAIAALHPGREFREVAWQVFLDPGEAAAQTPDGVRRTRLDAWSVLDRVDPEGTFRQGAIAAFADESNSGVKPIITALRAAQGEFRSLPRHGDELAWLLDLHASEDARDRVWWQSAAEAIATLDPVRTGGIRLRHAEPIRWCKAVHPEWLRLGRAALLEMIGSALHERPRHQRRARDHEGIAPRPIDDQFKTWRDGLSWGDALTILVVDEALRQPGIAAALFEQSEVDREDATTEYGGAMQVDGDTNRYRAVLFVPRPGQREGDQKFVASNDMLAQSHRALAHYHFHVQRLRNSEYAGPSGGDLLYAMRHGRTCIVFTSVATDTLNADLYQPDGATIDLGEISRPPPASR